MTTATQLSLAGLAALSAVTLGLGLTAAWGALALGYRTPGGRLRKALAVSCWIAFSSGVRSFHDGFTPATGPNLRDAREFIDALQADGGTNIAGALDAVLGSEVAQDRLPIVLFLTDGVPSVGEQDPERIAALAAGRIGRARVFTFGVGQDVNTYLLDRLAREGRGSAAYVAPDASVETAVGTLVGKLRRPALVNLHVVQSPVELRDLTPGALPDLFYGEELVVFGRYHGTGAGHVIIEGERNGRHERFTAEASFPSTSAANEFIPKLWASRRIGDLTRQIRLEGASEGRMREVRELGLRYGILTEYTSYLVQEPTLANHPEPRRPDMMQVLPSAAPPMAPSVSPAAQTGKAAFDRASESGRLSQANSLADADAAAERKFTAIGGGRQELRRAGGRMFTLRDGVWTDLRQGDSLRVVTVVPFSAAYFAVLRALPEITASLQSDSPVLIAGKQASLKIAAGGRDSLSAMELQAFVRAFRGNA